jgi:hypothetical protein
MDVKVGNPGGSRRLGLAIPWFVMMKRETITIADIYVPTDCRDGSDICHDETVLKAFELTDSRLFEEKAQDSFAFDPLRSVGICAAV